MTTGNAKNGEKEAEPLLAAPGFDGGWVRISIDNEDGLGAVEYSAAVAAEGPVTIERRLNVPSRCTAEIVLGVGGMATPARRGRVMVTSEAGAVLFTGYLPTEPVAVYAGEGATGPVYRARISAVSDEWLLDKVGSGSQGQSDGLAVKVSGTDLVAQFTATVQSGQTSGLQVAQGGTARALGGFAVQPAANWSANVGAAAGASYASYRVVDGVVSVQPAGAVTHAFSEGEGTLSLPQLQVGNLRELANDVTLSGAMEPAAYVQEMFAGDGTTTVFALSRAVFRGANRRLLWDGFNGAAVDTTQWTLTDGGNHLSLTGAGLAVSGGTGVDGQTTLAATNLVEMGGAVLAELGGVVFGAASDGVLAGFYEGAVQVVNCFAGWRVRQSVSTTGGVTVVVPLVNGAEVGTVYTPVAGHRYTLRLRLWCPEMQRVMQRYYCMVDGQVQEFGPVDGVAAPMQVVFELLDEGVSSHTPATVLYDTATVGAALTTTPAACTFAVVNSANLFGSVASVEVTRPGSLWVTSTPPSGARETRLVGAAGQGADCEVSYGSAAGAVTFFAGRVPVAGEQITVCYRTEQRAVARLADAASVAAEAASGVGVSVPGVSRWLGVVTAPVARSSADCESAAQAVLAMATARSAALGGSYAVANPAEDIWPGDVLALTTAGVTHQVMVRSVAIEDGHAAPELRQYKIGFANDWATEWADGLGLKLSERIASDAVLPETAASGPAEVLANLTGMSVVGLTGEAMQVDAGCAAPAGGGFEVRRRDWAFGVGVDTPDLVLRSPVRSFSVPRSAQVERFYVRMYDANGVYSRFSSAVFVNVPLE